MASWKRQVELATKAMKLNRARIEAGETFRAGKKSGKEKSPGKTDGKR
jgi:hypothetical protein